MNRPLQTLVLLALLLPSVPALSATVRAPEVCAPPGGEATVAVSVDEARGLAGFKIALTYDANILEFKLAARTEATRSMMHVVNDREPGRLIVVMAAARGITGKDLPLVSLTFRVRENPPDPAAKSGKRKKPGKSGASGNPPPVCASLAFTGGQLMGEDLKEIPLAFGPGAKNAP